MEPSYREVGDVRYMLFSMALWFQIFFLISHTWTVKCLSFLASSHLRPASFWLCFSILLTCSSETRGYHLFLAWGSFSAKQGRCLVPFKHSIFFFFCFHFYIRTFWVTNRIFNTKWLRKNEDALLLHHLLPKKNSGANLVMGIFARSGFLSITWLFPWCWIYLQALLVIPSPGGNMATLLVHTHPTPNLAAKKAINIFLHNILGPGSPWPHYSPLNQPLQVEAHDVSFARLGSHTPLELKVKWTQPLAFGWEWGRGSQSKKKICSYY